MTALDYRNLTWRALQDKVTGNRLVVLDALREHGPCTTRDLSAAMQWDILNVRPRVTELFQLGFVELCEDAAGVAGNPSHSSQREGTYRALSDLAATDLFRQRKHQSTNPQLQLL